MVNSTENSGIRNLQQILKYTFGILPIAAGLDKFFYILTDWSKYFPDYLMEIVPFELSTFVIIVGIIEIIAGILVFTKTELGAYVVSIWLALIALILIISGMYWDVAVRDIVMAISAFVLAKMTPIAQPGTSDF